VLTPPSRSTTNPGIDAYKPQDATTNPSLILAATKQPAYAKLIDTAVEYAKAKGGSIDEQVETATDRLVSLSAPGCVA
jgi:transaldolase